MKKTKKILILLLTCILLTACGSKTGLKNANLKKTTTYSIQGLKFEIPSIYTKSDVSSDLYYFFDIEDVSYNEAVCSLSVKASEIIGDPDINEEFEFSIPGDYFEDYEIKTKKIDNKEWSYAEAKSNSSKDNYYIKGAYIIQNDDYFYSFEYTNYTPEKFSCKKVVESITNSMVLE